MAITGTQGHAQALNPRLVRSYVHRTQTATVTGAIAMIRA
jgi:hypothetical protein